MLGDLRFPSVYFSIAAFKAQSSQKQNRLEQLLGEALYSKVLSAQPTPFSPNVPAHPIYVPIFRSVHPSS